MIHPHLEEAQNGGLNIIGILSRRITVIALCLTRPGRSLKAINRERALRREQHPKKRTLIKAALTFFDGR